MVPIRHVGAWNLFEFRLEKRGIFHGAFPKNMSDTIVAGDITVGSCFRDDGMDPSLDNLLVVREREENWFRVRILNFDQLCPVLLLFGQRQFVLLDEVVLVVVDRSESENALLGVLSKGLLIDVHAFDIVLD